MFRAACPQSAVSFPVQIFGVSFICIMGDISLLYGNVAFTAFAFSNGSVSISSIISTPFCPTILACMLYNSMSGPLSIHNCIPCGP